jgi:hypothetical protein
MPKPSTISRLPVTVKEKIAQLRDKGRTIDEILEHLEGLNTDISRSALGRYIKNQEKIAHQIRTSRQLAEAVGRQFGDDETSKVARTNIELLHSLLMKCMMGDDENAEITIGAKEGYLLSKAVGELVKASKVDVDRAVKIREEERLLATQKAAERAEDTARKRGLSADIVQSIKASILGVE